MVLTDLIPELNLIHDNKEIWEPFSCLEQFLAMKLVTLIFTPSRNGYIIKS